MTFVLDQVKKEQTVGVTERRFLLPFVLITSLFFLWAFGVNLNDILIPHLKNAFALSDFHSSFIQVAFFGGYFLAAFPAGRLIERIGYKKGILVGLFLCAAGAFLFLPASASRIYVFFLLALFVMACGQSFLEVAANPYVTILGEPASAERRLNFAQSFNAVGAVLSPLVGRAFILTSGAYAPALAGMTAAQLAEYRAAEAGTVKGPYLMIAGIFVALAVLIQLTHLPEVRAVTAEGNKAGAVADAGSVFSQAHLMKGVAAQFFYVGAQVGVASFVIRYTQFCVPGVSAKTAAWYLLLHQTGFMIGRFVGSGLMKRIAAAHLLSVFAAGSLLCAAVALLTSGLLAVGAVVLIGFFHSIMFPTIFALSIKNLGALTERGSSLLVMAIIGGAFFPAIMGRISDLSSIQKAFIVPLLCYVFILYFGLSGHKPAAAKQGNHAFSGAPPRSNGTTRYCMALDLKNDPDLIRSYKRYHERIWPEITESFRDLGIRDMEIYLVGTRLFMIMEVEERFSFARKAEAERKNLKVREWESLMWTFQQAVPEARPGEKWVLMDRIFKFES